MIKKMTQSYGKELYSFEKFEHTEPEEMASMEAVFELTRTIEPVKESKERIKESRSLKIRQRLLKKLKFNPRIHEEVIPIESIKRRTYINLPQVY